MKFQDPRGKLLGYITLKFWDLWKGFNKTSTKSFKFSQQNEYQIIKIYSSIHTLYKSDVIKHAMDKKKTCDYNISILICNK